MDNFMGFLWIMHALKDSREISFKHFIGKKSFGKVIIIF